MAKLEVKEQLKSLLRELFQLDNTDLDFGIYRILNLKSKEVEEFISVQLDAKVEEVKNKILQRQSTDIRTELEAAKKELTDKFQVDFNVDGDIDAKSKQYGQLPLFQEPFNRLKDAKERLNVLKVSEDTEKSIYNELYRFFDRYYEGGDFISKPRAGKNNYLIPYEGEEVKLYWANHDQYYIKTGENFKNYVFNNQSADPATLTHVEFKIIDAEVAVNNNKEEKGRLFIPTGNPIEWLPEERKLLVKFYYKVPNAEEKKLYGDKQSIKTDNKGINQRLFAIITTKVKEINDKELLLLNSKTRTNTKGDAQPIIQYHLERYTTVNKFDYFIHKNLKEFLFRELDFFLKNEVLSIQFLNPNWSENEVQDAIKNILLKASCIREIAFIIIDFIGELEDFQKRLFEKKKFVIQSDYCITLDLIPATVYDEIINYILSDEEKKQINVWTDLNFITVRDLLPDNITSKSKKSKIPTYNSAKDFLKNQNKLVLDTQYLPKAIKWKLISSIENFDEKINGLLVNSENWQALNFLNSKYKDSIRCIYIDPPFNTGDDDFVYKDNLQHSSWICMMHDRIRMSRKLLSTKGGIYSHIDYKEVANLKLIQENIFEKENFVQLISVKAASPAGFKTVNPGPIDVTEYILFCVKSRPDFEFKKSFTPVEYDSNYNLVIENIDDECINWRFTSIINAVYAENGIENNQQAKEKFGDYWKIIRDNIIAIYAINNKNRVVSIRDPQKPTDELKTILKQSKEEDRLIEYRKGNGDSSYAYKGGLLSFYSNKVKMIDGKETSTELLTDFWSDISWAGIANEGNVKLKNGKKPERLLKRIFEATVDTSEDCVLDYFAGSGTSTAVAQKLGYKWVGIEMGKFFDELTKKRMLNVLNGEQTGISEIQRWQGGGFFQYLKLEQYEDTLNNISIKESNIQLSFIDNIRYQLIKGTSGSESLINLEKFSRPFDYTMKIVNQNEPVSDTPIDLVTTFNFLLGIEIIRYKSDKFNDCEYLIVFGRKVKQQYIIIWRDFDETKINLTKERDWIIKMEWYNKNAVVFCNGDNAFSANPIEPEFIRLMTEPVN